MTTTKYLAIGSSAVFAFVAFMAFVHTPRGLALWGRIRGTQSCPYGMDGGGSPRERDARRALEAKTLRGEGQAATTAFLGFVLDKTRRADVDLWAKAQGAKCHATRTSSADLECKTAQYTDASDASEQPHTLFFIFNSAGVLKSIHAMTDYANADAAANAFVQLRAKANANFGSYFSEHGEPSAAFLSAGALRQVATEYRVQDVFARLLATRLTGSYLVEQKYRALTD